VRPFGDVAGTKEEPKPTGAPGTEVGNGDRATDPTMEKHREVAVGMGRQLLILAERRGGKATGELSERVSASDADSRVLRDDGIRWLQGSAQVEQQSRVTAGQEVRASPHGRRASQDASAASSDNSYRRRESFEGQKRIAGIAWPWPRVKRR
jgi:hypothetical protein